MTVQLGDFVKDVISGFSGVATSRHEYLNGCIRFGISPQTVGSDGKLSDGAIFDSQQVEATGGNIKDKLPDHRTRSAGLPGGPHNDSDAAIRPRAPLV